VAALHEDEDEEEEIRENGVDNTRYMDEFFEQVHMCTLHVYKKSTVILTG